MEINTSNSSCVTEVYASAMTVLSSANALSVVVCLSAIILVVVLKLYKKTVYRLALYQVVASLCFAMSCVMGIIFINYNQNPELYRRLCIAVAFWSLFAENLKLFSTLWLTVHLFCLAVFYKNMKRFESVYVLSSLLISATFSIIPLITNTYGFNGVTCWIRESSDNCSLYKSTIEEIVEQHTLWYGPSTILLLMESAVLLTTVIVLVCRYRRRKRQQVVTNREDQNWRAAKQLLPLAAYPMLFLVLIIPPLVFNAYTYTPQPPSPVLLYVAVGSGATWSLSAGTTLILHVLLSMTCSRKCCTMSRKKRYHSRSNLIDTEQENTMHCDTLSHNSDTYFSIPKPSVEVGPTTM